MSTISPALLLSRLQWRYATKKFDPARKIPVDLWTALEETLILTPSSYGLQPWKFLIIQDQKRKDALVPACYQQRQVADCSHLLVIAAQRSVSGEDVDRLIRVTCERRGTPPEKLESYRQMMLGDVVHGPRGRDAGTGWAKLQCYIALGSFMTSAALLGVDSCPMEGFSAAQVDEILDLPAQNLTAAVLCPAGYRSEDDPYGRAPKIRYSREDLIQTL